MKTLTSILLILAVGIIAGPTIYRKRHTASPEIPESPVAAIASQPSQAAATAKEVIPAPQRAVQIPESGKPATPVQIVAASATPATPFVQALDTLVSPQTSFAQKEAIWKQLRDAGELDQAIEALKQGALNHPTVAEYPAALGEAQLQKAHALSQSGGNISEMGILGMQADQSFDAALKVDPTHWNAQFFKATAMSYWPAELNKGDEVVQRFSRLIDQQETMPPRPEFSQTYALLGSEFQKLGQPEKAQATWQLGLAKFPGDPTLRSRIAAMNKGIR